MMTPSSPLLGVARRTNPLNVLASAISLSQTTFYIQSNYPELMVVVNYFEKTYLGSAIVDSEVRVPPTYPLEFWNHFASILQDPEFPRTSNIWWRGFTEVSKPE